MMLAALASLALAAPCHVPHAHTIASNRVAQVFRRATPDDEAWYGGCVRRDGVPRFVDFEGLDVESVEDEVDFVRLVGPYVATADAVVSDGGYSSGFVAVMDLRRRGPASPLADGSPVRFRGSAAVLTHGAATALHRDHDRVRALVLARTGAIAWIGQDLVTNVYDVRARHGHRRVLLAQGADVDPASLRLAGGNVSWSQGGVAHVSPLP